MPFGQMRKMYSWYEATPMGQFQVIKMAVEGMLKKVEQDPSLAVAMSAELAHISSEIHDLSHHLVAGQWRE